MNHTSKRLADLSPQEKRALLVRLLKQKVSESTLDLDQLARNVMDLNAEVVLDPTIRPEVVPIEPVTEPAHIFLTGATGFLGAFLLYELLQHTQAHIHCLVRCSNAEEGKKKLQRTLESYTLWDESLASRIIPVVGDLSKPLFGLSAEQFRLLARQLDSIFHSGAFVNWIYPYERLKPTNVLGTQEVLRLACHIKGKPLHFISTMGVFPLVGDSRVKIVREHDALDHRGVLYGGYLQSKWVAEKLVTIARDRGLPVCIFRPGMITGHSQTGAWNTNDVACRGIKGWIELGSAPDLGFERWDMTPVDYVSKAIVHLSQQKESLGKAFHLANPRPIQMRELFTWIRAFGYPLRLIPHDEWLAKALDPAGHSREDAVYSLLPLFALSGAEDAPSMLQRVPAFDCQNTLERLAGTSIVCPPMDAQVFKTYFSYFIRRGFLNPPPPDGTLNSR